MRSGYRLCQKFLEGNRLVTTAMKTSKFETVLVTGGAGYIGSHAVLALQDAGHQAVVLDNLSTGHRQAVAPTATFYEGDIADIALVKTIIAKHDVTSVLHFAGSIIVPESVADPIGYYFNNTVKSHTLLQTIVHSGVRRIIFSSTAAAYGVPETLPVVETAPLAPINPYGRSKVMTEWMLRDIAAAHGLDFGILRYFNVAGADPAGRAGRSRPQPTHLVEVAMDAVIGRRDGITVAGTDYATPDGTCVRDYVHVSDLADAHVAALDALVSEPGRNFVYNCGYGHGYSVLEVLDAVDRVIGRKLGRSIGPRRAGDPDALIGANTAIRRDLGWTPRFDDLEAIIRHAVAWAQRRNDLSV